MSPLHPQLNAMPVVVFTPTGWIRGTFKIPAVKNLLSFLNTSDDIFKLTDAILPGREQSHPFLALRRESTLLVIPQAPMEISKQEGPPITKERRLVSCLMTHGSIRGRLDVPETLRTSDFLLRNPGFIELHQCHIWPSSYLDPREVIGEAMPLVLVNSAALVGTTEEG